MTAPTGPSATLVLLDESHLVEYRELLHAAYAEPERLGVHFAAATADDAQIARHLRENLAYGLTVDAITADATGAGAASAGATPAATLVGSISLRLPWGPNPGHLGLPHIGWLAAHPTLAPKGTGALLIQALIDQVLIPQLHAPAVSLGTAADHPWLGAYYQRLGFEPVGSADLGLGHLTNFYLRPLDPPAYAGWRTRHADLLEGLTS